VHGGAQWPGASVDPRNGILYVPSNQVPWLIRLYYLPVNERFFPPTEGWRIYDKQCSSCHGKNREGKYSEMGPYIPSMTGATLLWNSSNFLNLYKAAHADYKSISNVTPKSLNKIYQSFLLYDRMIDYLPMMKFTLRENWQQLQDDDGFPGSKPPWGTLNAIDLQTGKKLWSTPLGEYDELKARGVPKTGQRSFGGIISTAGDLIFATGTIDKKLRAFDAKTGSEVWSFKLPFAGSAPPTTYMSDGKQYLVVMATGQSRKGFRFKTHDGFGGAGDAIVAFSLKNAPNNTR
jgi:quinoprotein glucose dehydrogenase